MLMLFETFIEGMIVMKKFFKTTKICRQLTNVIRIFLISIAVLFLFVTIDLFYINYKNFENPQFTDGELKVIMIDVGNGDCFLALQNNQAFLVDTGFFTTYYKLNNVLKEYGVKKIDHLVLTHPHRDHAGGIFGLLLNYKVDRLYMSDDVKNMKMSIEDKLFYLPMSAIIKYNNVFAKNVQEAKNFEFANSQVNFLGPLKKDYTKLNNYSLVFKLVYSGKRILFTGDMEILTEYELLNSGVDVSADILKIGHHGSNTSTSKKFLEAVNPEYAIVSCGNRKHNNYGHPVERIMRNLEKMKISLYRTDEMGDVEFNISNGHIEMIKEAGDYKSGKQLLQEKNEFKLSQIM